VRAGSVCGIRGRFGRDVCGLFIRKIYEKFLKF